MRVLVVGAGIIGLTSALRLREAGHDIEIVSAEPPEHTTSATAAAIWYPYRAYPEAEVSRWAARGFEVLSGFATIDGAGVAMREGYEILRTSSPDPWWAAAVPAVKRPAFDALPVGYADGYELTVPVIDMSLHLPWLVAHLDRLGVQITNDHLSDLRRDGYGAIVNCSGLGARTLCNDSTMTPVRGQVVVLEQVGLTRWLLDNTDPDEPTYIVPRTNTIVAGGTAQLAEEDLEVNPVSADFHVAG